MNKFLSKNKNFLVKKNFFDKKIFKIFYEELDKEVNKILKTLRITQYKKLSLDIKLLLLEEIDHKLISDLYSGRRVTDPDTGRSDWELNQELCPVLLDEFFSSFGYTKENPSPFFSFA